MKRRKFVAGLVSLGGSVVITGCIDQDENGDSEGSGDDRDDGENGGDEEVSTEGDESGYSRLMYDPTARGVEPNDYVFTYADSEDVSNLLRDRGALVPRNFALTEHVNEDDSADILMYDEDEEDMYEEVRDELVDLVEERGGYEIHRFGESVWGVDDEEVVAIEGTDVDAVRLAVDTINGESDLFIESDEDAEALVDAIGHEADGVRIQGYVSGGPRTPEQVEEAEMQGVVLSERGDDLMVRYGLLLENERMAMELVSDIEGLLREGYVDVPDEELPEDMEEEDIPLPDRDIERTPIVEHMTNEMGVSHGDTDVVEPGEAVGRVAVAEMLISKQTLTEANISIGGE